MQISHFQAILHQKCSSIHQYWDVPVSGTSSILFPFFKKVSFSESILFLKMESLSERTLWKWGSLDESKLWIIKRGSFSDRRFENRGQCGRTYPSHIFRDSPPPRGLYPLYVNFLSLFLLQLVPMSSIRLVVKSSYALDERLN